MSKENKITIIEIAVSALLLILGILIPIDDIFKIIIFIVSYLIIGWRIIFKAIKNIFHGEVFDEFFLMSLASIVAMIMGEFTEGIAVLILYQFGELFQDLAVDKSRQSITELMNLVPEKATIINGDIEEEVAPEDVKINDIILVRPGEKIPLDGIVIEGDSSLDIKSLTGESYPIKVQSGKSVLSGSFNLSSTLKIRVTTLYENSTVSKILELVENASSTKGKSERFITKFAKFYTPIVVILAVVLAVLPPIFDGMWQMWIHRALSFLVISCPCALVISVPLSFFSGIGYASKNGVLIKGSTYIEKLSKLNILCFDKTGTLTKGDFKVIEITSDKANYMMRLLASLERYSTHPLSEVIKNEYHEELLNVSEFENLSGRGLKGKIDGKIIFAGNERLMNENGVSYSKSDKLGTPIHVVYDNQYLGYVLVGDEIKKEAHEAIASLHAMGIDNLIMLTGDKKENAIKVKEELKLDDCYYELLPQDKVECVQNLKEKNINGTLAFIGDGLNDAPVLTLSDLGIAMGGLGSDASIEASDIVIMNDDLTKIPFTYKLSKRTMRIVLENIIFAIGVKVLILILSTLGITNMFLAIFADVGVAIIAIINAMRNLFLKIK